MINVIRANQRYSEDFGWLKTNWLFSFADYYDPNNVQFGEIRVFNDDIIEPGQGFETHDHAEMEIITIVLEGELTHQDSMGNKSILKAGDVQTMSAGRGLLHSEHNFGTTPLKLYQIWIRPHTSNLTPSYKEKNFSILPKNKLIAVASGKHHDGALPIHANTTIFRAALDSGSTIICTTNKHHGVLIYVTAGNIKVNTEKLQAGDQARVTDIANFTIEATSDASFILIDTHLKST